MALAQGAVFDVMEVKILKVGMVEVWIECFLGDTLCVMFRVSACEFLEIASIGINEWREKIFCSVSWEININDKWKERKSYLDVLFTVGVSPPAAFGVRSQLCLSWHLYY